MTRKTMTDINFYLNLVNSNLEKLGVTDYKLDVIQSCGKKAIKKRFTDTSAIGLLYGLTSSEVYYTLYAINNLLNDIVRTKEK